MNNQLVKFGLLVVVVIITAFVGLKPIVNHENEYRVIIANASEYPISSAIITGAGQNSGKIGPIKVGKINDFIFTANQDGALEYSIKQNDRELTGVINADLKKNQVGEIFVVLGEMYKVRIEDEFDI